MNDIIIELWQTVKRNKLRTTLTGLSVAWGIFILIVLLGAGNGILHAFEDSSKGQSMDVITIFNGLTALPYKGKPANRYIELTETDAKAIGERFSGNVRKAMPQLERGNIEISTKKDYIMQSIKGVYPEYQEIETVNICYGRFLNRMDELERRKVIVLHREMAEQLFSDVSASIGQTVRGNGLAFTVIGVYEGQGNTNNRVAYMPYSTMNTLYRTWQKVDRIDLKIHDLKSEAENQEFENQVRRMTGVRKDFSPDEPNGIFFWNKITQQIQIDKAVRILKTALWIIGICTLLSGIVGVSNIMLITVKERTREFGICKALGARPFTILRMVLLESVVITTFFGYIGMLAGIIATEYMNTLADRTKTELAGMTFQMFKDPSVDISIAIQATVTLVIAGMIAGFIPAMRAIRLKTIDALRAE